MTNLEIHGLAYDLCMAARVRERLLLEITARQYELLKEMVVTESRDIAKNTFGLDGISIPYIRIVSSDAPGIPSLDELVKLIKPVCDEEGLDIETLQLTGFYPKGEPLPK
ncbi:MAG: hypothetical protein CEN92_298 [Candidatus Berkelbacteria bacterium Licking1014_96]|uniref:Uncharacterized protein n=1 Tax=Candidatus Berkelbacteria bacterium Licking1014_96 TaxID=2017149 RepID=A0A554LEL9_9BACT|nr:MAG: hypothetical protein CEN92_298 [Candidatus Berkelbacteria bacterium Licking1014_96]